jgi:hypothetical protein
MDHDELPAALMTPAERWTDFAAALNALARFAGVEAEREYTRERKRGNKADQRAREAAQKESAHSLDQSERPTG